MLDDHTDRLQKNLHMAKRKEEATVAAREEIKTQSLREMQLQSEVNCVMQSHIEVTIPASIQLFPRIVTITFPA